MNSTDEVMLKKYICFDYVQSNTTFAKFIGVPVAFENNVLKLSTQMYREDISFSEMNNGTQIKLFDGFKKSESWGDGIVVSKYYVPATLDSFNIGKKISSNNSFEITVDIILNRKEKEMLELGEIPLSMDDKWFLYCQDNVFHLHMSWDGLEIFQGNIIKSIQKDDLWLISAVRTSLDWSCQSPDRKQFITNFLQSVIRNHLNLYQ